jgi:class 3 adenylate cyclase
MVFLPRSRASGQALCCVAVILARAEDIGLDVRAGVHTGEVEGGADVAGLAVKIAKRVCHLVEQSRRG